MAGREGLIDTAVKTSRSGYLQRCLIKQLESLVVNYDMTVRDNDGSIVQFLYGEDGIDVMNSKYLDRFAFLEQNFTSLISNYNAADIMSRVDAKQAENYKHLDRKNMKRVKKENPTMSKSEIYKNHRGVPAISLYHPLRYFGSIAEKVDDKLKHYIENESMHKKVADLGSMALKSKYQPIQGDTFKKAYYLKYMKSIAHPGENVGTIAGQSVGEPSTQMTLNTFHLAGHGAENMTLGIPRLKEILMTTPTNIKTPNMTVYFKKDVLATMSKEEMEMFAYKFKRIRLSDVTKEVKVSQFISSDPTSGSFHRVYKITLNFESFERINKYLGLSFKELVKVFSDKFVTLLLSEISKQLKRSTGSGGAVPATTDANPEEKKSRGGRRKAGNESAGTVRSSEVEIEIEEQLISKPAKKKKADEEEDEEEEEMEFNEDIDGVMKKTKDVRGYEDEEMVAAEEDVVADNDDEMLS